MSNKLSDEIFNERQRSKIPNTIHPCKDLSIIKNKPIYLQRQLKAT